MDFAYGQQILTQILRWITVGYICGRFQYLASISYGQWI